MVVENPLRPATLAIFFAEWHWGGPPLDSHEQQKKLTAMIGVVIEKIQVEVLNKNKIRKKPTCSDLFRMFVC